MDLSIITNKYLKDIAHIKGHNCKDIFTNFYSNIDSDFIIKWIDQVFNVSNIKCLETSINLREEGNIFFKKKNYRNALHCYNKSLNSAVFNSVEFCISLGNRSAVLYYLNKYTESIKDMELCFELKYPQELHYKIFIRLINCSIQLKLKSNALEKVKLFEKYIKNCEETGLLDLKVLESLLKQIEVLKEQINNINNETVKKNAVKLPELKNGENIKFPYASNEIAMQLSTEKGRRIIATENISVGDVLLVEKPFSFVPIQLNNDEIQDFEEYYCYNCLLQTYAPLSCDNCDIKYCSILCKTESWKKYHNYECLASCKQFWTQIGVGFLAFRMSVIGLSTSGVPTAVEGEFFEPEKDSYNYIYSLLTNIDKIDAINIFPNLVHAMVLTLYLKTKTDYFQFVKDKNNCFVDTSDDELSLIVGTSILKHMFQIIINASTIEGVRNNFYDSFKIFKQLEDNGKFVKGVGIYPSVSMMNHSCDTNISSFFINDYIIIKANRNISKGEEIFNCYGYSFSKHGTPERKMNLLKQYYFNCMCAACTSPSKPEMFHFGLQCLKCQKLSMPSNDYNSNYKCTDCNFVFDAKKQLRDLVVAEEYFDNFSASNKIDYLFKCEILRERILYKNHHSLYYVYLSLQLFYGHTGDFSKYWEYLQKQLNLDEILFGKNCLKHALNLRLGIIIFLDTLTANSSDDTCFFKMQQFTPAAKKMLQKCEKIFKLHYPEYKLCFKILEDGVKNASAIEYNF